VRIGFLFNHEAAHQIAHGLPIARAIARRRPDIDLPIFVARGVAEAEAHRLGGGLSIVPLRPESPAAAWGTRLSGGSIPLDRISRLARNRDAFAALDVLVVPEKTSLMLKSRFGLKDLRMVHTRHGAGDRAVGFDKASGHFDLVLLSGPKIRDRLDAAGLLKPDGYAMVGYPKFDLADDTPPASLFDNGRPTVLYNPHPAPGLSSWYQMGPAILDYFARSKDFNLIFAPHVMLFAKRFNIALSPLSLGRVGRVERRHRDLPHMLIDEGSRASIDMTYTRAADIYLGDASSQVYEFLSHPRPCVFVDPRRTAWQGNPDFAHWEAGPVVHDIASLDTALHDAMARPRAFRDAQRRIFAYSFDLDGRPSAERAADAILERFG